MLTIHLIQMEVVLNHKTANFEKVRHLVANKNIAKGGLIVLPEMFATGYIPEKPAEYAEDFSNANAGVTAKFLSELANETGCAVLGAGISFVQNSKNAEPKLQNHSSLYLPGNAREAACYNKRKPFFPEINFAAGDSVNLFKFQDWNIATNICYDLRFPELFRESTKAGAKLITVQAAWPAIRTEHWVTLLKARAIENQVYIAAVNQTTVYQNLGNVPLPLGGNSMIISPTGDVLASAQNLGGTSPEISEGIVSTTIFSAPQEEYRKSFPVLKGII